MITTIAIILIVGIAIAIFYYISSQHSDNGRSEGYSSTSRYSTANFEDEDDNDDDDYASTYKFLIKSLPGEAYDNYIGWGNSLCMTYKSLDKDVSFFFKGIDKYKEAILLKPANNKAYIAWALALSKYAPLVEGGKNIYINEALEKLEKALELNPGAEVYNAWGDIQVTIAFEKEEWPDRIAGLHVAIEKYKTAIEVDPRNAEAYAGWGRMLFYMASYKVDAKLFEESYAKYSKAHELDDKDSNILSDWANNTSKFASLTENEALYEKSIKLYADVYKIDPENSYQIEQWGRTLIYLADLKKDKDLYAQAADVYKLYMDVHKAEFDSEDFFGYIMLGFLLLRKSQCEGCLKERAPEIEELILKGVKEYPAETAKEMSRLYFLLKQEDMAFVWLEEALKYEDQGNDDRNYIVYNGDFGDIRTNLRLKELLDKYRPLADGETDFDEDENDSLEVIEEELRA